MTDRADEIAEKLGETLFDCLYGEDGRPCTAAQSEGFTLAITRREAAPLIRAYGDERVNAALKFMNKVVDDERSARLERNPRLRRECRNAALEEAEKACEKLEQDFGNEHGELCDCVTPVEDECNCHLSEFRKAIEALKEKP